MNVRPVVPICVVGTLVNRRDSADCKLPATDSILTFGDFRGNPGHAVTFVIILAEVGTISRIGPGKILSGHEKTSPQVNRGYFPPVFVFVFQTFRGDSLVFRRSFSQN